jgi:MFS family permease
MSTEFQEPHSEKLARRTFFLELWRTIPVGILDTAGSTFFILIAVRIYEAGDRAKEWTMLGWRGGLLLSFAVIWVWSFFRRPVNQLNAYIHYLAALCLLFSVAWPGSLFCFVIAACLSGFWFGFSTPLMTTIYQNHYPPHRRGQLFAVTNVARAAISVAFAWLAGRWFESHHGSHQLIMMCFLLCSLWSGYLLWLMPKTKNEVSEESVPFWRAFHWIKIDPVFRLFLYAYMMMGIANHVTDVLRVPFLASPDFGHQLSAEKIALITTIVPKTAQCLSSYGWGWLFDRLNFALLRLLINVLLALSIILSFVGQGEWSWIAGAALFGLSTAGGGVVWSLWVTKIAPPERVAEYMSVHTFLTGIRGVMAPLVAFRLTGLIGIEVLGAVGALMILGSCYFLIPERRVRREIAARSSP